MTSCFSMGGCLVGLLIIICWVIRLWSWAVHCGPWRSGLVYPSTCSSLWELVMDSPVTLLVCCSVFHLWSAWFGDREWWAKAIVAYWSCTCWNFLRGFWSVLCRALEGSVHFLADLHILRYTIHTVLTKYDKIILQDGWKTQEQVFSKT